MVTWSMRLSSYRSWERTNQNCSADQKLFLCFHVCPLPASQTSKKKLHHVGRFVNGQELGDGCTCVPLMRQHGFSWPKRMRCMSFPELVGDKPCMEGNRIVANGTSRTPHSSVPVLPTETTQLRNVREWRVAVLSTNKTAEKKCERIKVPLVKMLATTSLSCQTWRKKKQRLKLINSFRLSATSAPQSWGSFSAPFVFPPVNQMSQTKFLLATPFLLKGKGVHLLCASMAFDG